MFLPISPRCFFLDGVLLSQKATQLKIAGSPRCPGVNPCAEPRRELRSEKPLLCPKKRLMGKTGGFPHCKNHLDSDYPRMDGFELDFVKLRAVIIWLGGPGDALPPPGLGLCTLGCRGTAGQDLGLGLCISGCRGTAGWDLGVRDSLRKDLGALSKI